MAKFSLNPLRWLRQKSKPAEPRPTTSAPLLKPAAQPRKSGNIFMQLITLHKNLQSMELASRQGIDCSPLLQKASGQITLLKREAEKAGEEELAQGAGQLLAYLDTVSEGRLDLDEEGVKVIRDFIIIFKEAMGDAAPGLRALDNERLDAWDSRYQSLMARMKPIKEEIEISELDIEATAPEAEEAIGAGVGEEDSIHEVVETREEVQEEPAEEMPSVAAPADEEVVQESDQKPVEEQVEVPADEPLAAEVSTPDKPPIYEPSEELQVGDVVISDAEVKSARELMELGERKPEMAGISDEAETSTVGPFDSRRSDKDDGEDGVSVKSPVQLEEVERLKKKLLELHEKQEMLSSRMSGILGGLKKVVKSEQKPPEPTSVDDMELEQLEEIIFAGRKKG